MSNSRTEGSAQHPTHSHRRESLHRNQQIAEVCETEENLGVWHTESCERNCYPKRKEAKDATSVEPSEDEGFIGRSLSFHPSMAQIRTYSKMKDVIKKSEELLNIEDLAEGDNLTPVNSFYDPRKITMRNLRFRDDLDDCEGKCKCFVKKSYKNL